MEDSKYSVRWLTGEAKFTPPEYRFTDNGDGTGRLDSEFMSITGDNNDLLVNAAASGIHIANWPQTWSTEPERPLWLAALRRMIGLTP